MQTQHTKNLNSERFEWGTTLSYPNWSIHDLHKSHNTPLLPPKICIGIVFDFSWDIFMSQKKLQTMVMQKFFFFGGGGGGGAVIEVYYGIVQVVN